MAAGSASIHSTAGGTEIVQASDRAVINWNSFSIGEGELTRFIQPSARSVVLNRVTGGPFLTAISGRASIPRKRPPAVALLRERGANPTVQHRFPLSTRMAARDFWSAASGRSLGRTCPGALVPWRSRRVFRPGMPAER